jgi:DNA-binding transcriptional LysR family regulator
VLVRGLMMRLSGATALPPRLRCPKPARVPFNALGVVDAKLAETGQSRRVALTVPNFMMALVQLAESNLVATLPRHLVERHAARFNLVARPVPLSWTPTPCASSHRGARWRMPASPGGSRPWRAASGQTRSRDRWAGRGLTCDEARGDKPTQTSIGSS